MKILTKCTLCTDDGAPVEPGTRIYCADLGYIGEFVRIGPGEDGRSFLGGIWVVDPKKEGHDGDNLKCFDLEDHMLLDTWSLDPDCADIEVALAPTYWDP